MNYAKFLETMTTIWSYAYVKIIIVIIIAWFLNSIIKSIVNKFFKYEMGTPKRNKQLVQKNKETANKVILIVIKIIIWITAILMILSILDINTTSFLAGASFFGLIIGLGVKTFIESLVTGFFLIADGNISIGDYVRINDESGVVKDIRVRHIILQTNTGELNIQPVNNIKSITNYSIDTHNVLLNLKISMDNEFMKVMNTINKTLKEMSHYIDLKSDLFISGFNIFEDQYEIRIGCETVAGTNITTASIIKNELLKALHDENIIM